MIRATKKLKECVVAREELTRDLGRPPTLGEWAGREGGRDGGMERVSSCLCEHIDRFLTRPPLLSSLPPLVPGAFHMGADEFGTGIKVLHRASQV